MTTETSNAENRHDPPAKPEGERRRGSDPAVTGPPPRSPRSLRCVRIPSLTGSGWRCLAPRLGVNRKRIERLIWIFDVEAPYPVPRLSRRGPASQIDPHQAMWSLPGQSGLGERHRLCPDAPGFSSLGGADEQVQPRCAELGIAKRLWSSSRARARRRFSISIRARNSPPAIPPALCNNARAGAAWTAKALVGRRLPSRAIVALGK